MSWNKYLIYIALFTFSFVSCSESTLEEDAQKAAELTNRSNQFAMENEIGSAGKAYADAQEIIKKYRHKPDFDKFYQVYSSFLDINSYNETETNTAEEDPSSDSKTK